MADPIPNAPISVPNYLVQAILTTIFCCLPFGIVAIVFAAQVNGKLAGEITLGRCNPRSKRRCGAGLVLALDCLLQVVIVVCLCDRRRGSRFECPAHPHMIR